MQRNPFPRPRTVLNRMVDLLRDRFPPQHAITSEQLERWHERSEQAFRRFVSDVSVLEEVRKTGFTISDRTDFDSAWSLEVVFGDTPSVPPHVNYFTTALWTCLPVHEWMFDWFGQTAMDHAYGHLYAYYKGHTSFGEEVACYCQFRAFGYHQLSGAQLLSLLVPLLHRWHKQIPFTNYRRSKHRGL